MQQHDPLSTQSPFTGLTRAQREHFVIVTCQAAIGVGLFLGLVYAVLYFVNPRWELAVSAVQALPTVLICLFAIRLTRHDKAELGTAILLVYLLGLTALISVILGLLPAIAPVYMVYIVVAGMVFGPVGGYSIAVVASVLWLAAFFFVGIDLPPTAPFSGVVAQLILVTLTEAAFLLTAFLSQAATSQLWRALDDAAYDLIQANRQLAEHSEQKTRFLARMSHDLRTPLTAVLLSADLTLRRLYGPLTDKQEQVLVRIIESATRLQMLIDDILDISRIEAGQLTLARQSVSVSLLADGIRSTFEARAREKGIHLLVNVAANLPSCVLGDETRLSQILMNLTDNAIKYTDQGEVAVSIEPVGSDEWKMTVRDTGRGIHEADLDIIFEEFRQAARPNNDLVQGTGLGLAITRHLVRMMQGDIHVTSQLGRGSTFEVVLPLKRPNGQPEPE